MHQPISFERTDLQEAAQAFARWRKCKPTERARMSRDSVGRALVSSTFLRITSTTLALVP